MKDLITPQEIIHNLSLWIPDTWRELGPGQVILRLPRQTRNKLKELKSKDLNIRPDIIFGSRR